MKKFTEKERLDFQAQQMAIRQKVADQTNDGSFALPYRVGLTAANLAKENPMLFKSVAGTGELFNPARLMRLYLACLDYRQQEVLVDPKKFSMQTYLQEPHGRVSDRPTDICGTCRCIAGIGAWAGIGMEYGEEYRSWASYSHQFTNSPSGSEAGNLIWSFLFSADWSYYSNDLIENANRIRFFLSTGLVYWLAPRYQDLISGFVSIDILKAAFCKMMRYLQNNYCGIADALTITGPFTGGHTCLDMYGLTLIPEFDAMMTLEQYFDLVWQFNLVQNGAEITGEKPVLNTYGADSVTERILQQLSQKPLPSSEG